MKKFPIICVLVMMLAVFGVISLSAVEQPTITITSEKQCYVAGDKATVDIELNNNTGVMSFAVRMLYDKDVLKLVDNGDKGFLGVSTSTPNFDECPYPYAWYTPDYKNTTKSGVIASPIFQIKEGTPSGRYEVTVEYTSYDIVDADSNNLSVKVISGYIEVVCPHANKTSIAAVPATCMSEGTKAHEKCFDCGKLFLNGEEVTEAEISTPNDPANHNGETEIRNAAPATEEAEGYTGDTYCLGCNQKIKDGEKIAKLDHTHIMTHTAATAPTCTADGVVEHWICSKCGNIYSDEAGTVKLDSVADPKLGHKTELKYAKESTCTEDGYTGDEICTVCGETVKKGEEIAPLGHKTELKNVKDQTCGESGYTGDEICTVCSETIRKGEVIPPTGEHKNTEVRDVKDADCVNAGYSGDTYCLDCGAEIETGTTIAPTGVHDFEWVTVEEAEFGKPGLERQVCRVCQKVGEDREIPPLDCFHSSMEHHEKAAATCIAAGTCEYWHCAECGRDYSDEKGTLEIKDTVLPADPANHVRPEIRNAVSATCSAEGYTGDKYCADCNTLIESGSSISVNPNAHNYVNNVCTYCGHVQTVYYPTSYVYLNNEYHLASGMTARHVPDSMTMYTDGEYEWHYCIYCKHEYGKVRVVKDDDTVELIVNDPVQSGDDGIIPDVPVTEPERSGSVKDSNPPTGAAIAVMPLALAAGAVFLIKKK